MPGSVSISHRIKGAGSEKGAQKDRGFLRYPADLVRRLAIEFEIQLRLRALILPVREWLELLATESASGRGGSADRDAHPWCLPLDPFPPGQRLSRRHHPRRCE